MKLFGALEGAEKFRKMKFRFFISCSLEISKEKQLSESEQTTDFFSKR